MGIGLAANHGGFELKVQLIADFGAYELVAGDVNSHAWRHQ